MVPMSKFGHDHWSAFGYVETRIVDYNGVLNRQHMRCNPKLHPQFAHIGWTDDIPTILKNKEKLANHDDWDCIDDLVLANLLTWEGTGLFPVFKLTPLGSKIAAQLREHKAKNGNWSNFEPKLINV